LWQEISGETLSLKVFVAGSFVLPPNHKVLLSEPLSLRAFVAGNPGESSIIFSDKSFMSTRSDY